MNSIRTDNAPAAIGPYSQGNRAGDTVYLSSQCYEVNGLVFTSGQIPLDPATGAIPEGIAAQCELSCKNIAAILEAAGTGMDKVFKTTCFLQNMEDFAAFNEVYARFFPSKPASSCVAVKTLPKGVLCEIEAIAAQ